MFHRAITKRAITPVTFDIIYSTITVVKLGVRKFRKLSKYVDIHIPYLCNIIVISCMFGEKSKLLSQGAVGHTISQKAESLKQWCIKLSKLPRGSSFD